MFTFGECLNEVNLHEGEIVVDVDRGRLFYADETGMLIPTEDEEESGHVALSKLDRCALSHHLEKILEKYRIGKYKSEGAAREWSTVVIVIVIFIS